MKVVVNINRKDLVRLNLALFPRLKSTYIMILIFGSIALAYILFSRGIPESLLYWMILLVGSLLGGVVGVIAGLIIGLSIMLVTARSNNGVLGVHEYQLKESGLFESTEANEGLSRWSGIQRILVSKFAIVFLIPGNLFHPIPAHHFDSREEYETFCELATKLWIEGRNSS